MSLPNPLCVGIDVSKAILDIAAISEFAPFTMSNDADGDTFHHCDQSAR
ncbi:transposase [Escherichia coli M605]|uniref:Transposase n=1 Tax=Escherichia coli M605 TaxID=656417 RepID=F4SY69_ECOLX|nr:transposase [Escherichia coli M605]